jgi:predicted RNA-binding protein associated with RNAse of E/G family
VVYPDGSSRILDLDELADAHERGLVDNHTLYEALKRADKLVSDIYAGKFNKYRDLVDYLEKNNHEDTE